MWFRLLAIFVALLAHSFRQTPRPRLVEEGSEPRAVRPRITQYASRHERYARRKRALSFAEAEVVFDGFQTKLRACPHCGSESFRPASFGGDVDVVSLAELGGEQAQSGLPARLGRAVLTSMVPEPALGACMSLTLDLSAAGIPGVMLKVSIKGEIAFSVCSGCFTWSVESSLLFEYGFEALGVGLHIGFDVNGRVDIKEEPCMDAPESRYCRFLQLFIPPEQALLGSQTSRCHSDRPFSAFNSFVQFQWNKLRGTARGERERFIDDFDHNLASIRHALESYPYIFQKTYLRPLARPGLTRTLVATCVKADNVLIHGDPLPNSFCQLEIKLRQTTLRQSFIDVYGGEGARDGSGCVYDRLTRACTYTDRCVFSGPPSTCTFAPEFMGEVWRTSWVRGSNNPRWVSESHAFKLEEGSNEVMVGAQIWNMNSDYSAGRVGKKHSVVSVPATGLATVRFDLGGPAGTVEVTLRWLEEEPAGEETGCLQGPLDAVSAALASFVGKLPRYAAQVGMQLHENKGDEEDGPQRELGIDYTNRNFRGRYMARWLREDRRATAEESEFDSISGECADTQDDPDAPSDSTACIWSSETAQCEPHDYCQLEGGHWFALNICRVREFVVAPTCDTELSATHCCTTPGARCNRPEQHVCQTEPEANAGGATMECRGGVNGIGATCFCAPGLCYDAVLRTCAPPKGNCQRGNREQKRACCRDRARRSLVGINSGAGSSGSGGGFISSWQASRQGMMCTSLDSESDERVANFDSALRESRHQTFEERDSFHTEYVISVANLFIRTVADVQAMFNVYFADNAEWDDDCYTLKPAFQVFHEFESEQRQAVLRSQPQHSDVFLSHRVAFAQMLSQEGYALEDRDNPWCAWSWASGSTRPWHRAEFVKKDPPEGHQGHGAEARTPRHLNGTMMPQLWCELLSVFRSSAAGQDRAFGEERYRRGWSVDFHSACSQLTLLMPLSGNSSGARLHVWRRFDCETTVLGSAFLSLFPNFATRVQEVRARLGELLEDTLQCSGRINDIARQFRTLSPYVEEHCVVTTDEMVRRQRGTDFTGREERSAFLKSRADEALTIIREWIAELRDIGPRFVKDFQRSFAYGDRLTGLVYKSGGVSQVRDLFETTEKIVERMTLLENHLVEKAWLQRGQQNRALFPPPATYTMTTKTEVYVSSQSRDMCRVDPQHALVITPALTKTTGKTYEIADGRPSAAEGARSCVAGSFAPFNRLRIGVTTCTRQVEIDGELQEEKTWDVTLESVLFVEDTLVSDSQPIDDLFSGQLPDRDGPAVVRADRPMLAAAWAMARTILADPGSLFGVVTGSGWGNVQLAARNMGARARQLVRAAGNTAWDAAAPGITRRNYRILDVEIHLARVGAEPYTPTFRALYKDATVGRVDSSFFTSPVSASTQIHLTWAYDLSEVLAIAYHAIQHEQAEQHFSSCARCLTTHGNVYCHEPQGTSDCVAAGESCTGNSSLPISTVFDCAAVGGDDDEETELEL